MDEELPPPAPDHTEADAAEERAADGALQESRDDRAKLVKDVKKFSLNSILVIILVAGVVAAAVLSGVSANSSADAKDAANAARDAAGAAETSSSAATKAANAARDLAEDTKQSNQDAACRSEFNAPITAARTAREDAQADLLSALALQAVAALSGRDPATAGFVEADRRLQETAAVSDAANAELQMLIAAARSDPALFRRMCEAGPKES